MNNRTFAANVGWTAGDEIFFGADDPYLGREVATSIGLDLRPTARLQSQVSLTTSRFNDSLRGGSEVFDIKIIRGLTTFQFTERFLVRNIAEYNTFDKKVDLNVLFTYRVNGGTVFYVGYDDHYQQEDVIEDFEKQRFGSGRYRRTNRALFTKFQILFRP